MPRPCETCRHPKRERIERALVEGRAVAAIARKAGLSVDTVRRHAMNHLPKAMIPLNEARVAEHARTLLDRVEDLERRARVILDGAESSHVALGALRELRGIVELLGKVTGELRETPNVVVNVLGSREWTAIQGALFEELEAHPEIRFKIAQRLQAIGAGG